jgi:hypothetical protein
MNFGLEIVKLAGLSGLLGFCPSFSILENTKEHNVSESGSVSVLR